MKEARKITLILTKENESELDPAYELRTFEWTEDRALGSVIGGISINIRRGEIFCLEHSQYK